MQAPSGRPKTVTTIFSMLILLAIVSAVSVGTSLIPGAFGGRQFNGTPQARVTVGPGTPQPRGNFGSGTPGAGGGNFPGPGGGNGGGGGLNFPGAGGGNAGGGGNFAGPGGAGAAGRGGGFSMFTIIRALGLPFQVIGIINIALPVIGILLLVFCAFGVWKMKRWGLNLATLLSVIFLIGAVSALLTPLGRNINWLRIGLNALSLVGSLPILGLSFLPSVRDFFPKPAPKPKPAAR